MPAFKYKHGDRPLDGYTIEHGVGRGGFGEVYYALSDSGRQVALKAVQNYEEVELRGIGHCMNLKSPYLVSIFDVKYGAEREPLVIMEFVAGPSLRQLLDDLPEGLGTAKAAYFLREIAKGLTYLHDCGIVHRDLKPHNVFYEEGFVKIGDYSLSKVINTDHRSAHTMTVGTVHYMAPEISMGRYDHTVDIYALGVMLHEMITGTPPFDGESVGEVLMKHMAGQLDVTGIAEPFASVIQKAMAKDPAERYQSAEEMVQALYGAEHVQNSVTAFNPKSLSIVADRAAQKVPAMAAGATQPYESDSPVASHPDPTPSPSAPRKGQAGGFPYHAGRATAQLASSVGVIPAKWLAYDRPANDPLSRRRRVTLGLITIAAFVMGMAVLTDGFRGTEEAVVFSALGMVAISLSVIVARKRILPRMEEEAGLMHRLATGGTAALFALPVGFMGADAIGHRTHFAQTLIGVVAAMFILDWRVMTTAVRPRRVSLAPALLAGFVAAFVAGFMDGDAFMAFGMITGIAMAVQVSSPFDPVAAKKYARRTSWWDSLSLALEANDGGPVDEVPEPDMAAAMDVEMEAESSPHPTVSPQLRLAALILAVLPFCGVPVAGLHRFYVGKVGTGILWLFTFGFLGIGQLIDLILIALGQFRDSEDRMLVAWTGTNRDDEMAAVQQLHATPVNHYSSVPAPSRPPLRLGSLFLNMLGGLTLAVVLVTGLVVAVDIPSALSAGVLDGEPFDLDMARDFPDPWPRLVNLIGLFVTLLIATFTVISLVLARRGLGGLHMFRVIVASVGIFFTLFFVHIGFDFGDWEYIGRHAQQNHLGQALDAFLSRGEFIPMMVLAAVTFIASFFVLAWPAKQPRDLVHAPTPRREREVARR